MADFDPDAWMARQRKSATTPQPATQTAFDPDAWMAKQAKPQPMRDASAKAEAALIGAYDPKGYDNQGRPISQKPGFAENVKIGAERGYRKYLEPAISSLAEVTEGVKSGNFGPLREMAESAIRGTVEALRPPQTPQPIRDPVTGTYMELRTPPPRDTRITALQQQRDARYQATPDYQRSRQRLSELDRRAAYDPSMVGKATRGTSEFLTGAAPTLAVAVASRGALLPTGLAAAAQSANQPAMMGQNVASSILPLPAVAPLVHRLRGRPQTSTPAPGGQVASTSRLPVPDAPPTQQMPAMARQLELENALTAEVPGLPVRQPAVSSNLPELHSAELDPLGVGLASPRRPYQGAQGPRAIEELEMTVAPAQSQPQTPPPSTSTPWKRQPQQQALFKGAPASSQRTPPLEVITAVRKAGLLSGVTTHAKNIVGNLTFQPLEEISRIPASIVDLALSVANKRRTITGPSPVAMARAAHKAATEGVREAGQILRRGMTNQQALALQLGREINSGNKVLDFYVNGIFRTLGAEDAVFRKYALTRAVQDRARAQALTEARAGQIKRADIDSRAKQIAKNPDAAMLADSILDSEIATFNNPNLVNRFVQSGMDAIAPYRGGRAANFGVELSIPFRNAPSNAVAKILEYTPLGTVKNAAQVIKAIQQRAFTPEQQRQFATTVGRTVTGSSLILLGYQLSRAGLMTGYSETDPSKRNRDVAAGRTPGAILDPTTNTWHQVIGFGPIGPLLVIGATLQREEGRELKDESKRATNLAATVTQTIKEQPLMSGARDISEAITRPGSTGERLGRIAGSFVPTAVSKAGDVMDSTRREGKGFTGQVKRRVPFLREGLPPAVDVLGRPLEDRRTSFFDPTLTSTARDKSDPLMRELVKLDVGLSAPKKRDDESENDYRERKARAGRWFEKYGKELVESREYKTATRERRKAAVERLAEQVRELSKEAAPDTWHFSPQGLLEAVIAAEFRRKENTAKK